MGLHHQFLPPQITPLRDDRVTIGRAMAVRAADIVADALPRRADSGADGRFALTFRARDDRRPGDVYVCTGGSPRTALWGALMSTRARKLGAAGAVLDG